MWGVDAERGAWLAGRPRPSGTGYKPGADTHYPARGGACDFALCAEGRNEPPDSGLVWPEGEGRLRSFPTGRWSENLPHRRELFDRVAQVKRTGCRIDSRRAGQALSRSSRKFEMRIPWRTVRRVLRGVHGLCCTQTRFSRQAKNAGGGMIALRPGWVTFLLVCATRGYEQHPL